LPTPSTRQIGQPAEQRATGAWLTERKLLDILDAVVITLLVLPFFVI
jgi:hypothetical protein